MTHLEPVAVWQDVPKWRKLKVEMLVGAVNCSLLCGTSLVHFKRSLRLMSGGRFWPHAAAVGLVHRLGPRAPWDFCNVQGQAYSASSEHKIIS